MEEVLNTLRDTYVVNYSDCDVFYEMTIPKMLNLFEDLIGKHTTQMQIDMETVRRNYGVKWVVTKIIMKIDKRPRNTDVLQVFTWPHKPGFVKFGRSGAFKDTKGEDCVRFYSDWCILDVKTDKLLKTSTLPSVISDYRTDKAVDKEELKESDNAFEYVYSKKATFSDLDANRHVNNVAFVKFSLDVFSTSTFDEKQIDYVENEFLGQCYEGDVIDVYLRKINEDTYSILEKRGENAVFRMYVCFKQRNI